MATILQFTKGDKPLAALRGGRAAQVIIFPGVRYERQHATTVVEKPTSRAIAKISKPN